ncbi:unnamed protein product [Schistosoma curassoni]|uniref:4Fe-4S ferredoxin-type domain-containing protein n=1 Tax=Schistosoma curassoni TaxID=6186 RepID=A0A183KHE4_9TREM|nr:unnamed protein product [Schistosoma curassoni]
MQLVLRSFYCRHHNFQCQRFYHLLNTDSDNVGIRLWHFTHPDILDRVPVAFLILGGILLALQIIGFILLRPKPLESTQDRDTELVVRNRINSDPNPVIGRLRSTQTIVSLYRLLSFMLFGAQYIDDDQFLSIVATFSSLFNAGGRVIWGAIVDRLSFKVCNRALIASVWIEDRKMSKRCKICNCCTTMCKSLRVGYHGIEGTEAILDDTS